MSQRAFVSTAIPYVNAKPHVGFALELIQADVIARYLRLKGRDVFFSTGTDENSLKNLRAAQELGISPQDLCDQNSESFRELADKLDISFSDFIRTSRDPRHSAAVNKLWLSSRKGDIYKGHYESLYCVGCEEFYSKSELKSQICPEHQTPLEPISEENYFFRLSSYQNQIIELLETGKLKIVPESRCREILSFAREGLKDFSISRTKSRAGGWGIQVPHDSDQVIYVWYDALTNYIAALDFASDSKAFHKYWADSDIRIHVIGKGIIRFHAVYWPAMLLSVGLPLPDTLLVHGYLTIDGQKISKSHGKTIDPISQIAKYGVDSFRYYLLRSMSPFEDGDYSEERLRLTHNSDLANNMGNLISRLEAIGERAGYMITADDACDMPGDFHSALNEFRFNDALAIIWSDFSQLNQLIEVNKPWEMLKAGRTEQLEAFLNNAIQRIRSLAVWLEPFMPSTSTILAERLKPGRALSKSDNLFPRL